MAKGNAGGKRGGAGGFNVLGGGGGGWGAMGATMPQQPQPQDNSTAIPTPNTQQAQDGVYAFSQLSDQQKAQAVLNAVNSGRIYDRDSQQYLPNTDFQKFAYLAGIDNTPNMVTEDQLKQMKGDEIFRGVASNDWDTTDGAVANTLLDNHTWYSDTGGSALGRGIYFGEFRTAYSYSGYNGRAGAIMHGKITNGRTIDASAAERGAQAEIASGSAFGRALARVGYADRRSIWAVANNYNVMTGVYKVVLSRGALSMSYTYHKIKDNERNRTDMTWDKLKN